MERCWQILLRTGKSEFLPTRSQDSQASVGELEALRTSQQVEERRLLLHDALRIEAGHLRHEDLAHRELVPADLVLSPIGVARRSVHLPVLKVGGDLGPGDEAGSAQCRQSPRRPIKRIARGPTSSSARRQMEKDRGGKSKRGYVFSVHDPVSFPILWSSL